MCEKLSNLLKKTITNPRNVSLSSGGEICAQPLPSPVKILLINDLNLIQQIHKVRKGSENPRCKMGFQAF
jgi:hypothetical protein